MSNLRGNEPAGPPRTTTTWRRCPRCGRTDFGPCDKFACTTQATAEAAREATAGAAPKPPKGGKPCKSS